MDEEFVLKQLLSGNYKNFSFIVEKYNYKVINISFKFLLNQEDAEDVAQEVFLEIYKSIKNFKQQSSLNTWIYRITISKTLDFIRKKNTKKRFAKVFSFFSKDNFFLNFLSSDKYNPEKQVEENEKMNLVYENINSLPENQRIAFVLNKINGIKNKEIADIMNVEVNNVDILIFRARKKLQKKLQNYFL